VQRDSIAEASERARDEDDDEKDNTIKNRKSFCRSLGDTAARRILRRRVSLRNSSLKTPQRQVNFLDVSRVKENLVVFRDCCRCG